MSKSPRPGALRVLLVRAGALGDVVLLRPAVAALRAAGHSVSLLAPSHAGAALRGPGASEVDAVLPWEAAPMAGLLTGAASLPPEVARLLAPFDAIFAYTQNAVLIDSLGATGARVVARAPWPPDRGPHAARWLAEATAAVGADPSGSAPLLVATPEEDAAAREWIDRMGGPGFVAIHPGSGSPRKNWPAERFADLGAALAPDRQWLLAAGPADTEAAAALSVESSAVVASDLPVRVLGAVLSQAGLYVGNDSGVSHLAAAYGAPTVALFGPTDPALWAPVGPRVHVLRSADHTMAGLAAHEVLAAADNLRKGP